MFYAGYVDIFDAGPVLQARLADLRAARESVLAGVKVCTGTTALPTGAALVSTTGLAAFRALVAAVPVRDAAICLTTAQVQQLGVSTGATVRHMPLSARPHAVA